jgi:hypothetical protein
MKCGLCNVEVKSINGLAQHLRTHSSEITPKEYYLKYINPLQETKCPYCSEEREFEGLNGFNTTCGNTECVKKSWLEKLQETRKQKAIDNGTYKERTIICPIDGCGDSFWSTKGLEVHLSKKHSNISKQEYYLTYINPSEKDNIKCPYCDKQRMFYNIVKGFRPTCGDFTCRNKHRKEFGGGWDFLHNEENNKKREEVSLERYGIKEAWNSIDAINKRSKSIKNWWDSLSIEYRNKIFDKGIKLRNENNLKKYGISCLLSLPEIKEKSHQTMLKKGLYGKSKIEKTIYEYIKLIFPDAIEHYKDSPRYQDYEADVYIPSLNLLIEVQGGHPIHGGCAFDLKNQEHLETLEKWKIKAQDKPDGLYTQMIRGWTVRDPHKRDLSMKNGFNFLEIFDFSPIFFVYTQIKRVIDGLSYDYPDEKLIQEIIFIRKNKGSYKRTPMTNKLILSFQPSFYKKENELWKNPIIRRKIIENRMKYLNKKESELTDRELLRGFKISGTHYGFSHFSPFWIKKFIEEYHIESLYDPCGGWGHRLLGAESINYIYNDINTETFNGVKNMCDCLNIKKTLYNFDATEFTPIETYDAVFTCPPYFNTEDYGNKKQWGNYQEWLSWFGKLIDTSIKKETKYFAFVMTSKYADDLIKVCNSKGMSVIKTEFLGNKHGGHFGKSNNTDILVICHPSIDKSSNM